jgi:hypothetical protein
LESRLLSGERWIYVDQQSLLKSGMPGGSIPPLTTSDLP